MTEIIAREYRPDEVEIGLEIRNNIFPPLTLEEWKKGEPQTASIAFIGDEPVGFIPLSLRKFKLAPGVAINTAFENAVGTKKEYRSRGVGSAMIETATQFLKGRADALFVYRGEERSNGYKFYTKTGHIDLHYMRHFRSDNSIAKFHQQVDIFQGTEEILKVQDELNEVFQETYHSYGGYPPRFPGYWTQALNSTIYNTRPADFYLLSLREKGVLTAYIIGGVEKRFQPKTLRVLEMASRAYEKKGIKLLLETAAALSAEKGFEDIDVFVGDQNPFINTLAIMGFTPEPRGLHIMSRSFDSKSLFDKVWKEKFYLPGIELQVWTPYQEFTLIEGDGDISRKVTIEMKEETLTRWLMGRIDFKARVKEGTITLVNGNDRIVDNIAKAIPFCPWEYHHIDYI